MAANSEMRAWAWAAGLAVLLAAGLALVRSGSSGRAIPERGEEAERSGERAEAARGASAGPEVFEPQAGDYPPGMAPMATDDLPPGAGSRVELLLAAGLPRQERPWADEKGHPMVPSPGDGMIRGVAQEVATAAGPEALEHARRLLESGREGVGLVGAELLADMPEWAWDARTLDMLAGNADAAVALHGLQALADAGKTALHAELLALLGARWTDADWAELTGRGEWTGTALRGLLDLARATGDADARLGAVAAVLEADGADYSARMRALLELRELLPFEEYRQAVRAEYAQVAGQDPNVWQMGLAKLLERIEGPAEVLSGPAVLSSGDVQVMLAREYPATYEDVALRLESMARDPGSLFHLGVTDTLAQMVERARQTPLSADEAAALARIEALLPQISETDASRWMPSLPPGF